MEMKIEQHLIDNQQRLDSYIEKDRRRKQQLDEKSRLLQDEAFFKQELREKKL